MSSYPLEFKSAILSNLLSPRPPSIAQLSRQTGVSDHTLRKWLKNASDCVEIPKRVKRAQHWTKQERLKALLKTSNMTEEQLNAYCRKNALVPPHLKQWEADLMGELSGEKEQVVASEIKSLKSELKKTQKELKRKDKALAEASAVLFLKKKAQELWGDPEDEE